MQFCSYHGIGRAWAEDLTQETFECLFRKLTEYKHQGKALNYLYTIVRNLCIDWEQKQHESVVEEPGKRGREAETAGILGIGLPLVKYRIKKAKELLREFLEAEKRPGEILAYDEVSCKRGF